MIFEPNSSCVKQPLFLGSSETTREASFFDFSHYQNHGNPEQIPFQDPNFLAWFVGFCEGDGSFICDNRRLIFLINQADRQLLSKIRTKLGFGSVRKYISEGRVFHRFQVSGRQNLLRLIYLFNGNLVLDKVYKRFAIWVSKANQLWKLEISIRSSKPEVGLNNAWLSGFIEAEGGFYARVRSNKRFALGYQLQMKFYITQEGEEETLLRFLDLLESKARMQHFWQDSRLYNRIEVMSFSSHSILIRYLDCYPCKGKTNVLIKRWKKVFFRRERGEHLTPIGLGKLRRLCGKVIETQREIEDIVQRLETLSK
jgi:hypothetical protein